MSSDLWSDDTVNNTCPSGGFVPETRSVVQKVEDVKNFICVLDHPCKVVNIQAISDAAKIQFSAIDIFSGKKFKATFPQSGVCFVPVVTLTDFQLVDIYEKDSDSSHVILLDNKGFIKDNLKLPTDQDLLSEIKSKFTKSLLPGGKEVFVCVASALGKEQIVASNKLKQN